MFDSITVSGLIYTAVTAAINGATIFIVVRYLTRLTEKQRKEDKKRKDEPNSRESEETTPRSETTSKE